MVPSTINRWHTVIGGIQYRVSHNFILFFLWDLVSQLNDDNSSGDGHPRCQIATPNLERLYEVHFLV